MYRFRKTKELESNVYFLCNKCHQQIACEPTGPPKEFAEQIKELASLYDKRVFNEEAYHELLKVFISIYVSNALSSQISCKLDKALEEKLAPHNFLEALV
jgi:hypothetical protein